MRPFNAVRNMFNNQKTHVSTWLSNEKLNEKNTVENLESVTVGHTRDIIGNGSQAKTGQKCKIFSRQLTRMAKDRPVQHSGKSCMIELSNLPTYRVTYLSEIQIKDKTDLFKSRNTKRSRPGKTWNSWNRNRSKKGAKPLDRSAAKRKKCFFHFYYFILLCVFNLRQKLC